MSCEVFMNTRERDDSVKKDGIERDERVNDQYVEKEFNLKFLLARDYDPSDDSDYDYESDDTDEQSWEDEDEDPEEGDEDDEDY